MVWKKVKNNKITKVKEEKKKSCAKDNCPPLCWHHVHASYFIQTSPEHFTPFLIYLLWFLSLSSPLCETFSTTKCDFIISFPIIQQRFSNFSSGKKGCFARYTMFRIWFFISCVCVGVSIDWFVGWFLVWHKLQLRMKFGFSLRDILRNQNRKLRSERQRCCSEMTSRLISVVIILNSFLTSKGCSF